MKEFQLIKDVPYEYNADKGLHYSSPCRGMWNIVHYGTLVPGGHQIYVCSTSCLRGVVLTTAEMGAVDKLSTITVAEDNILDGDMEEQVLHGTEKIIESLPQRPRMVMIFISCMHHFMAVNYQRVYKLLRKEYPDIDFVDCYMDPIMRRKSPVMPNIRRQVLRPLQPGAQDMRQVSFVGDCFPMDPETCDLKKHLEENGIRILDLTEMKDYDEMKQMEHSCVNFTFHSEAEKAGKDLELRLGQKWLPMRESYVYDEIEEDMAKACQALGIPAPSKEENELQRDLTEQAAAHCREVLDGTPLAVDSTAVDRPLEFALYLLNHGFEVEAVLVEAITEDEGVFRALQKKKPDLKVYSSLGWNMRIVDRSFDGKIVGIGQKSAYFHDTPYFVNEVENAGMYGFSGIRKMFSLIEEAAGEKKDMETLIQHKGWGCSACE